MISAFIITLRETLEASLIVGLILGYLKKTKQSDFNKFVWIGLGIGVIGSLLGAYVFVEVHSGFEGVIEQLFEGITMLVGATLLTTLILWIKKNKYLTSIHLNAEDHILQAGGIGLMFLVTVLVLREGIETVIYLGALSFSSGFDRWGALLGILIAVSVGYLIFIESIKLNLKKLFTITTFFLVLFAAGFVSHGVHELQEAKVIPVFIEQLWDINPPVVTEGVYPLMHENGVIGSFLKGLFGYNGNPSLLEVLSYFGYLGFAYYLWNKPKSTH